MNQIGTTVRSLRESKGLAQWQLAEKIGVSQAMLSHIEKNKRKPSWLVAQKLAHFFGVTLDELIGESVELEVA